MHVTASAFLSECKMDNKVLYATSRLVDAHGTSRFMALNHVGEWSRAFNILFG